MSKTIISTENAPAALGAYCQAVRVENTVYLSGQIPLNPTTMEMPEGFEQQTVQVFENLKAVAEAAGGSLNDIVKLNIILTALDNFAALNEVMGPYFSAPYPARAAVGVASLPRNSCVEMDAVMYLGSQLPSGAVATVINQPTAPHNPPDNCCIAASNL